LGENSKDSFMMSASAMSPPRLQARSASLRQGRAIVNGAYARQGEWITGEEGVTRPGRRPEVRMLLAFAMLASAQDVPAPDGGGVATYPLLYPYQCKEGEANYDLEVLYFEGDFKTGLQQVDQRLAVAATSQLYWMKARFLYEMGELFERDDPSLDKEAHYQKMLDTADKGLALAPGDLHLRFARGIAMGRLGTTRGILASLFMADDVESDWKAVATSSTYQYASIGGKEVLPCDAYHALGIFYRLVPDWWIVQALAGTRGDLSKSVEWHQKAVKCKPNEAANWLELGVTQLCLGQDTGDEATLEAGRASLRKAQGQTAHSARAKIDVRNAGRVLADESMACEYSRDGQQDLDESKLKQ
jgi:hypothetical protein